MGNKANAVVLAVIIVVALFVLFSGKLHTGLLGSSGVIAVPYEAFNFYGNTSIDDYRNIPFSDDTSLVLENSIVLDHTIPFSYGLGFESENTPVLIVYWSGSAKTVSIAGSGMNSQTLYLAYQSSVTVRCYNGRATIKTDTGLSGEVVAKNLTLNHMVALGVYQNPAVFSSGSVIVTYSVR